MTSLDDLLQAYLERIEAGEPVEDVVRDLPPDQAEELESLLTVAVIINRVQHPEPNRVRMAAEMEKIANRQPGLFETLQRLVISTMRSAYVVGFTLLIIGIFVAAILLGPEKLPQVAEEPTATGTTVIETASPTPPPVPTGAGSTAGPTTPTPIPDASTPVPTTEPTFAVYGTQPVVTHGPSGQFDSLYTDPGAVIWHDGYFHMFRNGTRDYPDEVGIAYLKSEDGVTWTEKSEGPVFRGEDVSYAGFTIYVTDALVTIDQTTGEETWSLYFHTISRASDVAFVAGAIGRATAPSPLGPWEADPEPIIVNGPTGSWDSFRVNAPSVVRTDNSLLLYYSGVNGAREERIGLATSTDGVVWEKYNNPQTTAARYALSDPVFERGFSGFWDGIGVFQPHVETTDEGFMMLYAAREPFDGTNPQGLLAYGLAASTDGINWDRLDNRSHAFSADDIPRGRKLYEAAFVYQEGAYFIYVEAATGGISGTNIWAGLRQNPLMP